jgi:hypothetical protein
VLKVVPTRPWEQQPGPASDRHLRQKTRKRGEAVKVAEPEFSEDRGLRRDTGDFSAKADPKPYQIRLHPLVDKNDSALLRCRKYFSK